MEIANWISKYLSQRDLDKIEAAVKKAEEITSGEIRPILVKSSLPNAYRYFKIIVLPLLVFMAFILHYIEYGSFVEHLSSDYLFISILVLFFVFAISSMFFKRFNFVLFPNWVLKRVHQRAEQEFYLNQLDKTKDNTGIMIFISFLEKRVIVLADKGISEKCPQDIWEDIVKIILNGKANNEFANGIVEAVLKCGEILAKEFPIQNDDTNELPNHLIIKE